MAAIFTNLAKRLKGLFGYLDSSTENVSDEIDALREFQAGYTKEAADAMASDVTAAKYFYYAPRDVQIVSAKFVSAGTATANGSNFGTIIVNKHDGAGGAGTVAASGPTSSVSIAAGVPFDLALSATLANIQLSAGQVLSFQITKTGSGVVIPAGYVRVGVRYL
jgi:hypothetical protein